MRTKWIITYRKSTSREYTTVIFADTNKEATQLFRQYNKGLTIVSIEKCESVQSPPTYIIRLSEAQFKQLKAIFQDDDSYFGTSMRKALRSAAVE